MSAKLVTEKSKLIKRVNQIDNTVACELLIHGEHIGYELNRALTTLNTARDGLERSENELRRLGEEEQGSDDKLAATAGSKRDKQIAASKSSLDYARIQYEQALARHQLVTSAAENEFQSAAIKLQGRLNKERTTLAAKVQQFKAAVTNAENAVARLKTKKSKPLIKASFAKKPLEEEIQRINTTLESNRQREIELQAEMRGIPVSSRAPVLSSLMLSAAAAAPPPPPPAVEESVCQQCQDEMIYIDHEYHCCSCPNPINPEEISPAAPPAKTPASSYNKNYMKEGYSTPHCVPGCPLDASYCAAHDPPSLVEIEREVEANRSAAGYPPRDYSWRRKERPGF